MIMWNKGYIGYFILSRREVVQEHDRSFNSKFSFTVPHGYTLWYGSMKEGEKGCLFYHSNEFF